MEEEIKGIKINYETEEGKFSVSEYEKLKNNLEFLKSRVAIIGLLPEQIETIYCKHDHITELAINMNKFDWKNLFIGSLISLIIQLSISPESSKQLWNLIKQIFSNFIIKQ